MDTRPAYNLLLALCFTEIESKYDKKMKALREELELRRKTEIHEIEEVRSFIKLLIFFLSCFHELYKFTKSNIQILENYVIELIETLTKGTHFFNDA